VVAGGVVADAVAGAGTESVAVAVVVLLTAIAFDSGGAPIASQLNVCTLLRLSPSGSHRPITNDFGMFPFVVAAAADAAAAAVAAVADEFVFLIGVEAVLFAGAVAVAVSVEVDLDGVPTVTDAGVEVAGAADDVVHVPFPVVLSRFGVVFATSTGVGAFGFTL
jgi:hypothetical protein